MLADDELLAGSDVQDALRGDGVEAAATGVAIGAVLVLGEQRDHGEVVVGVATDALVGAQGALVDLGGAGGALGLEGFLLLGGGLHDRGELLLLGLEVLLADEDAVGDALAVQLALLDGRTGLADVLLGDGAEQALVLQFLVDGIELAAVGDVLQLAAVFLDLGVQFDDLLVGGVDAFVVPFDHLAELLGLGVQAGQLLLEEGDLRRQFAAQVNELVDGHIGLLQFVKDLELLLGTLLGLRKILAQRDEGLTLVDRSLHFRCFLGGSHILYLYLLLRFIPICKITKYFS